MPYMDAAKNAMLDELASLITHVSLHDGDPSTSGANEIAASGYARQAVTWGSATGGVLTASNEPEFTVPASTTVAYVGFWTADSAGTFLGSDQVTSEVFGAQGTYTLTSIELDLNAA